MCGTVPMWHYAGLGRYCRWAGPLLNEGIHLDLDTWIVPGQIRKANLCRGLGNRYTPAGTEVLISSVAHNTPPPFQAAQNATTVNTRSSVAGPLLLLG